MFDDPPPGYFCTRRRIRRRNQLHPEEPVSPEPQQHTTQHPVVEAVAEAVEAVESFLANPRRTRL